MNEVNYYGLNNISESNKGCQVWFVGHIHNLIFVSNSNCTFVIISRGSHLQESLY